jgi:hypothetical protein
MPFRASLPLKNIQEYRENTPTRTFAPSQRRRLYSATPHIVLCNMLSGKMLEDSQPTFAAIEYFHDNYSANPDEDDDHDGLNNRDEYLAGTHPNGAYLRPLWDAFRFHVLRHIQASLCHTWQFRQ